MGNSIKDVAIYVADLARPETFYTEVLGLEVRTRITTPNVTEVIMAGANGEGSSVMLAEKVGDSSVPAPAGIWKIFLGTDDMAGVLTKAVAAGAQVTLKPLRLETYCVTIAMIQDLDGYAIEVAELDAKPTPAAGV